MTDFACPLMGQPDCRGYCTLTQIDGRTVIYDADCFRHPVYPLTGVDTPAAEPDQTLDEYRDDDHPDYTSASDQAPGGPW